MQINSMKMSVVEPFLLELKIQAELHQSFLEFPDEHFSQIVGFYVIVTTFGSRYSGMNQVKFVKNAFKKFGVILSAFHTLQVPLELEQNSFRNSEFLLQNYHRMCDLSNKTILYAVFFRVLVFLKLIIH